MVFLKNNFVDITTKLLKQNPTPDYDSFNFSKLGSTILFFAPNLPLLAVPLAS